MVKYIKQNNISNSTISSSTVLPSSITLAPDGSPVLVGEATVWNDQISNSIVGHNTVQYSLAKTTYTHEIPYGNIDDKIWVKVNIPKGKSIIIDFIVDNTKQPDNDAVFELFDDFDNSNVDTAKWDVYGSYTISDSKINFTQNGKGIVSKKSFSEPIIIKSKLYYTGSGWFDHIYGIGSDNRGTWWTIEDGIVQDFDWVKATNTRNYGGSYTNNYYQVPAGEYVTEIGVNPHYIIINGKKFVKRHLAGYKNPGKIAIANYSANAAQWDWIYVIKYLEKYPHIEVNKLSDTKYQVIITNDTGSDIVESQIPIELPTNKTYKVIVSSETPSLVCNAFPYDKNSYFTFYTQFSHSAKINGKCEFHLHTYIPPDAPNGNVKLYFEWLALPVNGIRKDEEYIVGNTSNAIVKKITKTFTITDEMKGKHIVLSFGELDVVRSLSQIIFCKLERLATDPEDTFEYVLPVLYIDWHTEIDTLGSQDIYKK